MKILVKDVPGLKLPIQANDGEDAAYDIFASSPPMINGDHIERPLDGMKLWRKVLFIEYATNLFIAPEDDVQYDYTNVTDGGGETPGQLLTRYHTRLFPRSSISKYNLILCNAVPVIDGGYRNQIFLRFKYYFQPEDMVVLQEDLLRVYGIIREDTIYQQGDKIVQMTAARNIPIQFQVVKDLPPSKRGLGGFGASGR